MNGVYGHGDTLYGICFLLSFSLHLLSEECFRVV